SFGGARVARVHLYERIEDRLDLVGRDTDPAVAYHDVQRARAPLARCGIDAHHAARRRELRRVPQKIYEDLLGLLAVGPYDELRGAPLLVAQRLARELRLQHGEYLVDEIPQRDLFDPVLHAPRLDACQIVDVVDEPEQMPVAARDSLENLALLLVD